MMTIPLTFYKKRHVIPLTFYIFQPEKLWKRQKWWQALDRRKETHNNQKRDSFWQPVASVQVRFHLYKGGKVRLSRNKAVICLADCK